MPASLTKLLKSSDAIVNINLVRTGTVILRVLGNVFSVNGQHGQNVVR